MLPTLTFRGGMRKIGIEAPTSNGGSSSTVFFPTELILGRQNCETGTFLS
jgi:hypothetical protein